MSRAKRTWIKGFFRSAYPKAKRILVFANSEWNANVAVIESGKPTKHGHVFHNRYNVLTCVVDSYDPTTAYTPRFREV